jgi:protein-L-isoaspartate(D-aspartate) O-methyltransferase
MLLKTNEALVEHLNDSGVLRTPAIERAFLAVDRKDFVPEKELKYAYEDHALPIAAGQTISQPFTVAFMLELLDPQKGERVLDVGSGSGWTTALLAETVGPTGKVFGVERIPELVEYGKDNLAKYPYPWAQITLADSGLESSQEAPFARILVSAAATEIPQALVEQLAIGGVMVIPVQDDIVRLEKVPDGALEIERHPGFVFVPLVEQSLAE